MAAPVVTIGTSAPTEPPKPIVTELASTDEYILWRFKRLFFLRYGVKHARHTVTDIVAHHASAHTAP